MKFCLVCCFHWLGEGEICVLRGICTENLDACPLVYVIHSPVLCNACYFTARNKKLNSISMFQSKSW
ncbi:hypothetical protein RJT34_13311 [Clitoria ternatea]|uniref:Secreted protein n=1 Tax=Clitoria ternatea TaxID=43366 RepID=A0AAN9PLB4_CLITE